MDIRKAGSIKMEENLIFESHKYNNLKVENLENFNKFLIIYRFKIKNLFSKELKMFTLKWQK